MHNHFFLIDPCHKTIKICQWRNKKPLAGHNCNQCCDPHDMDSAKYIFDWRGTIQSTLEPISSVSAERGLHHIKSFFPSSLRQKLLFSFPYTLIGNRAWLKDLNPHKHLNPKETHISGPTTLEHIVVVHHASSMMILLCILDGFQTNRGTNTTSAPAK